MTSCLRPNMGECKCARRFLAVDDDRAFDSTGNDGYIAQNFNRHIVWLILLVLPRALFEEGHVLPFTRDLTLKTDVNEIIGKKLFEFSVIPLQERRCEAILDFIHRVYCFC